MQRNVWQDYQHDLDMSQMVSSPHETINVAQKSCQFFHSKVFLLFFVVRQKVERVSEEEVTEAQHF
jgi:hypothetical protein